MTRGRREEERLEENGIADANSDIVRHILEGREQVISHGGASQYRGGGISACGLAALNCVRVILEKEQRGLRDAQLLYDILSRQTAEEITSICTQWSGSSHLEVEEILSVPLFDKSLSLFSSHFARPSLAQFKKLLRDLQSGSPINASAAVVITRPPEIVACVKIVTSRGNIFLIFDSHPRPTHPNGAGFIFNTSIDATALHLHNLLAVDGRLLADKSMQWQAQLLGNFSGHMLVSKGGHNNDAMELTQTVLESSLAILSLRAEVADLKLQNVSLTADATRLEIEVEELGENLRETNRKLQSLKAQSGNYQSNDRFRPWKSNSNTQAGPSSYQPNTTYYRGQATYSPASPAVNTPLFSSSVTHATRFPSPHAATHSSDPDLITGHNEDLTLATQIQMEWEYRYQRNAEKAAEKQREFEEEDRRLSAEREELARSMQAIFSCGVCLEDHPEDGVARIAPCEHSFCRDCIRSYVVSKLDEHRYPIYCPTCMADKDRFEFGEVSSALVQQVGIPEDKYQILEEMQLSAFSILTHCRKCQHSMFVDRDEYQDARTLVCPLPGCGYLWCKSCQQAVPADGPTHSCDGSNELEHLVKQRGWKYCPGCRMPIQKDSGCNHMTCITPGCNTHFCYLCGETIVKSALPTEVSSSLTTHFRQCSLFEEVPDQGVPP